MKDVAVGILLRNGSVLACQRRKTAKYGLKWEFPGGKLEPGETPERALERELQEELAIEATIGEELFRQEWIYTEGTDNPYRDGAFRVFYFLVRQFNGEIENRAFEQVRWVAPRHLLSLDILEGNRDAVHRLIKYYDQQTA